jgi:hypothetical protein
MINGALFHAFIKHAQDVFTSAGAPSASVSGVVRRAAVAPPPLPIQLARKAWPSTRAASTGTKVVSGFIPAARKLVH